MYFELRLQLVTLQFSSALLASIAPSPGQVSTWKEKTRQSMDQRWIQR